MSFTEWSSQLEVVVNTSRDNLGLSLSYIGVFWGIHLVNALLQFRLNVLGIWPRHLLGLPGIFFSPFLHGSFTHLLFNSVSLFVLINLMLLYPHSVFVMISLLILIFGGLATWAFGRNAIHIGSSGMVLGYWGFLLLQIYYNPSVMSIFVVVICIYHLGGLSTSLIPSDSKASWEAHIFGFAAGVGSAYLLNQGHLDRLLQTMPT